MIKRLIAILALGVTCSAQAAPSSASPLVDQLRPYLQVKTVEGDEFRVRAFFSPSCSFSKQYLPFFLNLSNTLPQDKQFAFTPVVNKADGLTYAFAFAAVQRFYPRHVNNFVEASLRGVQDMGLSTRNWVGIERIGKAAGIPVPMGRLVEDNLPILKSDVEQLMTLRSKLKITNTPSVSVAGTYIVTPEFTGGDTNQFSTLVNAVVSMVTLHE
ncbi:thiol-disulfide isomerase [Massilia sp. H6]|uniref:thiol-disulfide isomerase n=1 Tax=Massilia sp. H6 TaxID=2970464 RepID=UPI00216A7247|nr:thiol-disulfide isomerase [Massilia sp. H6]UVW30610.1 thiol-disulfide isomerase [Massilia sp. H6]